MGRNKNRRAKQSEAPAGLDQTATQSSASQLPVANSNPNDHDSTELIHATATEKANREDYLPSNGSMTFHFQFLPASGEDGALRLVPQIALREEKEPYATLLSMTNDYIRRGSVIRSEGQPMEFFSEVYPEEEGWDNPSSLLHWHVALGTAFGSIDPIESTLNEDEMSDDYQSIGPYKKLRIELASLAAMRLREHLTAMTEEDQSRCADVASAIHQLLKAEVDKSAWIKSHPDDAKASNLLTTLEYLGAEIEDAQDTPLQGGAMTRPRESAGLRAPTTLSMQNMPSVEHLLSALQNPPSLTGLRDELAKLSKSRYDADRDQALMKLDNFTVTPYAVRGNNSSDVRDTSSEAQSSPASAQLSIVMDDRLKIDCKATDTRNGQAVIAAFADSFGGPHNTQIKTLRILADPYPGEQRESDASLQQWSDLVVRYLDRMGSELDVSESAPQIPESSTGTESPSTRFKGLTPVRGAKKKNRKGKKLDSALNRPSVNWVAQGELASALQGRLAHYMQQRGQELRQSEFALCNTLASTLKHHLEQSIAQGHNTTRDRAILSDCLDEAIKARQAFFSTQDAAAPIVETLHAQLQMPTERGAALGDTAQAGFARLMEQATERYPEIAKLFGPRTATVIRRSDPRWVANMVAEDRGEELTAEEPTPGDPSDAERHAMDRRYDVGTDVPNKFDPDDIAAEVPIDDLVRNELARRGQDLDLSRPAYTVTAPDSLWHSAKSQYPVHPRANDMLINHASSSPRTSRGRKSGKQWLAELKSRRRSSKKGDTWATGSSAEAKSSRGTHTTHRPAIRKYHPRSERASWKYNNERLRTAPGLRAPQPRRLALGEFMKHIDQTDTPASIDVAMSRIHQNLLGMSRIRGSATTDPTLGTEQMAVPRRPVEQAGMREEVEMSADEADGERASALESISVQEGVDSDQDQHMPIIELDPAVEAEYEMEAGYNSDTEAKVDDLFKVRPKLLERPRRFTNEF